MSAPARPPGGPDHSDRSSLHRFTDALTSANVWHQVRGDHVDFRCPLPDHPDRDASGTADWRPPSGGRPGAVRLLCHACGRAASSDLVAALGLRWADLFDDPPARQQTSSPRAGGSRRASPPRPSSRPKPVAGGADQVDKSAPPRWRGERVATYVYRTAAGEFVGECLRYEGELDPAKGKRLKRFSWRRRGPAGGWVYKMPTDCPLYRLPDLAAARETGAAVTVWLTEGEKNADALAAAGVLAVSAPNGAHFGWRDAYTEALAGAHLVVVVDRDEQGLSRAEAVCEALRPVTASLCAVRTPVDKRGADASDHLDAGLDLDEFELVPVAAAHGAPAVPVREPAEASEGEVLPFPARPDEQADRNGGGSGGGPVAPTTRRMVREHFEQVANDGGAVVQVKRVPVPGGGGDSEEIMIELLDARVQLVRRIAVDPGDGSAVRTTHVDLIATRGDETVELTRVPWDEFRKGAYVDRLPWPVAWKDTPSGRSTLANAITKTSGPVPVVPAYGSLGWREISGDWTYVHAGGGINAAGTVPGIEVEVSPRLGGFSMPDPPAGAEEFSAALHGVLAVLDALPARVAAPVMGAPFRAVLGAEPRASVFVVGHTGSRKSGLAALAQQVFCPSARHNRLPVGAGEAAATVNAMEELLWQASDMLLVLDDLAPDRGAERAATRANELLRKTGNGEAKARQNRTGGLREDRRPGALAMLTGEDGASSPSAESRTLYVPLAPGDVPLDVIRQLSRKPLIQGRNATGAALARYVASRMPVGEWIEEVREDFAAALLEATGAEADPDGLASRRADTTAELAVGWRALLDAALDAGALDAETAAAVWARCWTGLVECLAGQVDVVERRGLVERAADLLRSVLRSGRGHLEAEQGGAPVHDRLSACGWRRDGKFEDLRAGGDLVGWMSKDRRFVWLEPGAAFAAIERQGRAESSPLAVTNRALVGALLAAKLLSTEKVKGRRSPVPQVRRPTPGGRQRVWELPWSWLWPDDGQDTPDDGTPSPDAGGPADPPPAPEPPTNPPPAGCPEPPTETAPESPSERPNNAGHATSRERAPAPATAPLRADSGGAGAAPRYRAAGVVVDTGEAHLIGGETVAVPAELDSIPAIVEWAAALNLGVEHNRSRDDAGQIWVMPDLAHRCGLRKRPAGGSSRATTSHPAVRELTAQGWSVGHRGLQPWTHVWRPNEAGMYVVIVPWLTEDVVCSPTDPPSVATLAERLDLYSTAVGNSAGERQPWLFSAATTGTSLLKLCRASATTGSLAVKELPPPALDRDGRRWEVEFAWQRGPTRAERDRPFVVSWDCNAQYLAAAAGTSLGLGEPRHLTEVTKLPGELGTPTAPARAAKLPPGYWRVPRLDHDATTLLPDLCDPTGGEDSDYVWITTPTLVVARQHGYDLRPTEAWTWDQSSLWAQSWAHAMRDGLYLLDDTLRAYPDDDEIKIVRRAVKLTYAAGIGMLGSKKYREGSDHYRPDARHHFIGMAKANLFRKCARAAAEGWAPLGIHRDAVLFASNSDDPEQTPPPGFRLGTKLGEVKWNGSAPMADIADALAASSEPSAATFGLLRK